MADGDTPSEEITSSELPALNVAYKYLLTKLREAKELYQSGNENAGREGAIRAGVSESLHAPLGAIQNALVSLDEGKVLPLLTEKKRTGRPRDSGLQDGIKGLVAFHVTKLTEQRLRWPWLLVAQDKAIQCLCCWPPKVMRPVSLVRMNGFRESRSSGVHETVGRVIRCLANS